MIEDDYYFNNKIIELMIRSKNHVPFEMYESISCVKTTSPSFFQQRTKSAKSFYNNQSIYKVIQDEMKI